MRGLCGLVMVALVFAETTTFAGDKPSAEELLASYQKSVERLDRVRSAGITTPREFRHEGRAAGKVSREFSIAREGTRWNLNEMTRVTTMEDETRFERATKVQTLIGADFLRAVWPEPTTANPNPKPMLSEYRGGHPGRVWWALGESRVLFGRVVGDAGEPLWEVMTQDANLERLPETETIAGHETFVVTSRGKYGEHRVWLDPKSGCLPRRIEIRKQTGDLFNDEQLGSRPVQENAEKPKPGVPTPYPLDRREIVIRIDEVRIEEHDGVPLIMGFAESTTTRDSHGREFKRREEFRVQQIDIKPQPWDEGEFQFDPVIPNGTTVSIFENLPLEFGTVAATAYGEWIDGKVRCREGN